MNQLQFNLILGLLSLFGYLAKSSGWIFTGPLWLMGLFLTLVYIGDYWAFLYKLKTARGKFLYDLSGGDPYKKIGETKEPGCMIFYAFLIRMVFRIVIAMFALFAFGGSLSGDLANWQIGFFVAVVLFELFNMMYSMFETHIFNLSRDEDSESENTDKYWEKEGKWRVKVFGMFSDRRHKMKEVLSAIILIITAYICTAIFWDGSNSEFVDFIVRSKKFGESPSFVIIAVLVSSFILCLFFLLPLRLAFWIEQKMHADTRREKINYRLSVLFAGTMIVAPTLVQLLKSYILS